MNEGLSLTYNLSLDDLFAFSIYHQFRSPATRNERIKRNLIMTFSILLMGVLLAPKKDLKGFLIFTCVWIVGSYFLYRWLERQSIRERIAKLYSEGKNKSFVGKHTIRITDSGIVTTSEVGEDTTKWAGIKCVAESPGYAFIYNGTSTAFIISEKKVENGDFRAFVDEVRMRAESSQQSQRSISNRNEQLKNDGLSLTYTLSADDLAAGGFYHGAHSRILRRETIKEKFIWAFNCFILFVVTAPLFHYKNLLAQSLAWIIIYLLLLQLLRRQSTKAYLARIRAKSQDENIIGKHTISIAEDGLVETSAVDETKVHWNGIERVDETPGYAFVFTGALSAFTIPASKVESGDFRAFVDEVRRRVESQNQ